MLILPITRSWLLSRMAQRIYFVCALLSFALIATWMALLWSASSTTVPRAFAAVVLTVVLLPGIAGAALLWVAMWYFWFGFDPSGFLKRAVWFVLLGWLGWLAASFYYFLVYRRTAKRELARDSV